MDVPRLDDARIHLRVAELAESLLEGAIGHANQFLEIPAIIRMTRQWLNHNAIDISQRHSIPPDIFSPSRLLRQILVNGE
jgi:hypothetical protein